MIDWCGDFRGIGWISHTLSPCWFETGASAALLVIAVAMLGSQFPRFQQSRLDDAPKLSYKKGMTGLEAGQTAATAFLTLLHAVHFIVAAATHTTLLFHTVYQGVLAAVWVVVCISCWRLSKSHAVVDFRCVCHVWTRHDAACISRFRTLCAVPALFVPHPPFCLTRGFGCFQLH